MKHFLGVLIFQRSVVNRKSTCCPEETETTFPRGIQLASIYKSLSLPHLDYCSVVWGNIEQSGTCNNWNRLGCQITPDPL